MIDANFTTVPLVPLFLQENPNTGLNFPLPPSFFSYKSYKREGEGRIQNTLHTLEIGTGGTD